MALRSPHGNAATLSPAPRIEVPPADELGAGEVQRPLGEVAAAAGDGPATQFTPGSELARLAGAKGGRVTAQRARLAQSLGLRSITEADDWKGYLADALDFVRCQGARLADIFGELGPGAGSCLQSAGLQLAASRRAYDAGDVKLGSVLSNDSRQNLLAAHHLAELDWKARKDRPMSTHVTLSGKLR